MGHVPLGAPADIGSLLLAGQAAIGAAPLHMHWYSGSGVAQAKIS
jgi:hypothetical protein